MLQSNNEPDLTLIDSILVDDQPGTGVVHFNATIRNSSSAPATTGTVPISWEKVRLGVPLSGGIGVINETTTDLDLNGDGDKIDTLSVTWVHNETRPWDANINGEYVYALRDDSHQSYYINGNPKLFQLGTRSHFLYEGNDQWADFRLDALILHHSDYLLSCS
jgi:hypothetical protein